MSMAAIRQRLAAGKVVFLDGAIGTELQKRGAPMDDDAWCAVATESHPHLLRAIHEDYIRAGVDVITTNTFSSSRVLLGPSGRADRAARLSRRAVEIALEARERAAQGRPVAVAGSISHMVPVVHGGAVSDPSRVPSEALLRESFRELAETLAAAGCDLLLMEMMSHPVRARLAIEAAKASGLPLWIGLSARSEAGRLVSYVRESWSFGEVVPQILAHGGEVAGVMHTNVSTVGPALQILRAHWSGPLMAYPDSGHFKNPDWVFEDIIPPADFGRACVAWVDAGVRVVGGCCGLSVEHIAAMIAALRSRQ
jgi:S-methylmethionine-dependent homocysteine/selenocysteine methylase